MSRDQLQADQAEGSHRKSAAYHQPPDDKRKAGVPLHRTNGEERKHRDRGQAANSPRWREHDRRFID
jgi:hypothetical protein